jgi:hypothetical protein
VRAQGTTKVDWFAARAFQRKRQALVRNAPR